MSNNNNERIAKNTIFLYSRMLITMAVGIYTSRVVLAKLGVDDYGIYNVVGGFVAMFAIISQAMATATQRFLSFELGKGIRGNVTNQFSSSLYIHIFLSFIVIFFAETIGLWFVNNELIIPSDRLAAANWVYQFSIITFIINIISVPYNGAIIAYEKMSAFAYVGIYEAIAKLLIVYVLSYSPFDVLVYYALLLMLIQVSVRFIYGIYVSRHFPECHMILVFDKEVGKRMFSFVGWNMIGSSAGILEQQGINILLNTFFGPAVNAARGVASTILHALSGFVSNFQVALNPQIVKSWAADQKEEMFRLVTMGSKFAFSLMLILAVPVFVEADYILSIWLVEVPEHAANFLRIVILTTLIDSLKHTHVAAVHACGKVKFYQLTNGLFSLLCLPVAYIILYLGFPPESAMITSLSFAFISHFIRLTILKRLIDFPVNVYLKDVTFRLCLIGLISIGLSFYIKYNLKDSFLDFLFVCLAAFFINLSIIRYLALTAAERRIIDNTLFKRVK